MGFLMSNAKYLNYSDEGYSPIATANVTSKRIKMTVEAAPTLYPEYKNEDTPPQDEEDYADETLPRRHAVVIRGGGQNTKHFGPALARLNEQHPVHVVEVAQPHIPVAPDRLHLIHTPKGAESIEQLFGGGTVRAVYNSLVPHLHEQTLIEDLERVGRGQVDFVVVAKPAVRNLQEMRAVDLAKAAAEEQLRLLRGAEPDLAADILYVHEHYIEKGAWHELREKLGVVTERLGRLSNVIIDIEEAQTIESEGRKEAFAGGALEDLGPHVISLGLNIQSSINSTDRYSIPNRSTTTVDRFRYHESELPSEVETGFVIRGETHIIDGENDDAVHDLGFIWRGGKGLVDKKEVLLEFVHPDTGESSVITVDLKTNTLLLPESVQDLFPITQFDDNGYGYVVESGLNGGGPERSFQSWDEARIVTKWSHQLASKKSTIVPHAQGTSLHELTSVA